jgi:hypothetical protein
LYTFEENKKIAEYISTRSAHEVELHLLVYNNYRMSYTTNTGTLFSPGTEGLYNSLFSPYGAPSNTTNFLNLSNSNSGNNNGNNNNAKSNTSAVQKYPVPTANVPQPGEWTPEEQAAFEEALKKYALLLFLVVLVFVVVIHCAVSHTFVYQISGRAISSRKSVA